MNKSFRIYFFALATIATLFLSSGARAQAQARKNSKGESFFIVASVDLAKSQILLKFPTEVTTMVKVDAKTQYFGADGKVTTLANLRPGDTVWVASSGAADPTATRITIGPMTVAELHQIYLDYPEIK